jgi:hypothetical protein
MPRPVFILCAEAVVVDKLTNFTSVFEIIEKVNFQRMDNPPPEVIPIPPFFKMAIIGTWMRNPDEGDDVQFENEFLLTIPPDNKEIALVKTEFSFSPGKHLFRFIAKFNAPLPLEGSGMMEAINRVRRKGDQQWASLQSYPIVINEVAEIPKPSEEPQQI